jgi:lysozyme
VASAPLAAAARRLSGAGRRSRRRRWRVDWRAVKAIGADFAYIDASASAFARDPAFVRNLEAARAAGLQVGAVHRYDPCQPAERQAANFVTVVPRDAAMLPPAVELDRLADDCPMKVGDAAIESELMTFLNQIETHTGKPAMLKISSKAVREPLPHRRAIDRNLWLVRTRFQPDYAGRPWTLWTATRRLPTKPAKPAALGGGAAMSVPIATAMHRAPRAPPRGRLCALFELPCRRGAGLCRWHGGDRQPMSKTPATACRSAPKRWRPASALNEDWRGGLEAVAVIGGRAGAVGQGAPVTPCGRCRQVLNEVAALGGTDPVIWCAGGDGVLELRLSDLLPRAFGPASLWPPISPVLGGAAAEAASGRSGRTIRGGMARGRLLGGNLTILSTLMGTGWLPAFKGAILFIEDVNEAEYRIDRMLQQLRLAGVLGELAGIAFGQCTSCRTEEPGYRGFSLDEVIDQHLGPLGIPAFTGGNFGHVSNQLCLPSGAMVELDADARTLRVLEPVVS